MGVREDVTTNVPRAETPPQRRCPRERQCVGFMWVEMRGEGLCVSRAVVRGWGCVCVHGGERYAWRGDAKVASRHTHCGRLASVWTCLIEEELELKGMEAIPLDTRLRGHWHHQPSLRAQATQAVQVEGVHGLFERWVGACTSGVC